MKSNTDKTKILVTGANGQLGLTFQKLQNHFPSFDFIFCSSEALNITDKNTIQHQFSNHKPDYCINCAAYTNVEQGENEPEKAFLVNAEGVQYLAETCKNHDAILIHISTDYVFDGKKRTPYEVTDTPNPINIYGKSKLEGEEKIKSVLKEYFIVRTSWLYSKEFGKNFYKTILERAKRGEELRITDAQKGSPTDTVSLVNFILTKFVDSELNFGVYHFSDSEAMSWYGFAKKILEDNGLDSTKVVKYNNYKTLAERPTYSVLASTVKSV
ncbi:dTDP-4-dehydrorhamnose reductase [Galbibacter mesophilus]|uniref:dTDP-4-dehydrorhamnose reductase n=1 Tax=Galbibacter mesophilus TaxID=379069 RepID=UPI00191DA04E|nr:dTDP-4-dehydrorhamnose reductase [Galbibacter mesophilus]MCM5663983.1 dTDP-4-dehydrorhamnose reductase [Galbibacter mesophilus]